MFDFGAFIWSMVAVTLAEMGDKTQLLAMCFATRFKPFKVLLGVFLATILNHALAVAVGYFLSESFSSYRTVVQMIASLSFVGFGLWTIKGDSIDSCDTRNFFGPVITVGIAFFIAEIGDKTQLATVALGANFKSPVAVLFGTTLGMLVADSIGIVFGVVMNRKIPETKLKWISASIFIISGLVGYINAAGSLIDPLYIFISTLLIIAITALSIRWLVRNSARAVKKINRC